MAMCHVVVKTMVARAWKVATSGRPGPVVVALPENTLNGSSGIDPILEMRALAEPSPDAASLADARALLERAERPLMMLGGSMISDHSQRLFERFAEQSHIPAITAFRFQDCFNNHSPAFCGEAGVGMPPHVQRLIREADVILAVNVRFGEMTTNAYTLMDVPVPKQKLIHVHGAESELGKIYVPTIGIQTGPNAFAAALEPIERRPSEWSQGARKTYEAFLDVKAQPSPVDMASVIKHLRTVLPDDVILTNGAGNFTVWSNKFFPLGPEARLLAPQSGAMGYGVPAAIAAKVAHPDRRVVCFAGDGDFQMNCQELATAKQAGAQPIILILNNGIYGTIRAHQETHFPGRVSGTTMESPDFAMLAQSYGFHGERVSRTEDFAAAFERALASPTGAVLDLEIAAEAITPNKTLTEIRDENQA